MLQDTLHCPNGQFNLLRPGANQKQPLRAWDAADEYLIDTVYQHHPRQTLSIFNDQFGALGTSLHAQCTLWVSDSYCATQALELNNQHNNVKPAETVLPALSPWPETNKLALMKLPKNLSYLKFLLYQCYTHKITTVLIAGMMKHLPKNILPLLMQYGEVERFPFKKKATVFQLKLKHANKAPYPKQNTFSDLKLISHANVFGRDTLDPGADFFINNIHLLPSCKQVADLCCGSGILGIKYKQLNDHAQVDFFDESHMAVQSAKASWQQNNLDQQCSFQWDDGLSRQTGEQYDLILCNPPFHEQHTIGDHIAKRLFKDAKRCLNPHGHLIVVGNRHLAYAQTLKKYFNNVESIARNSKFDLIKCH